jgi:PPOX class probable F420-dependent enzyme
MEPRVERPSFDPGYGVPTSEDGLLPWEWAEAQLVAARNYWICTTRPDGRPHASPVWGIWLERRLCFSCSPRSVKGRNLARNPSTAVHLESGDDVVIVEGTTELLVDEGRFRRFADAYAAKYDWRIEPGDEAMPGYELVPRVAFAWREREFPRSATRYVFA